MKTAGRNEPLPTFRVNAEQYRNIYGLYAGLRQFEKAEEMLGRQVGAIPNGKRDLHMLLAVGRKLADHIVATVPEEKRDAVKRQIPHTHFDILITPRMSMVEKYQVVVDAKEMNTALYFAHEQCKFCVDGNCRSCKLGKTLDRMMTYDREGKSWANVDFGCMLEE